jgi:hypothetical protein
MDYVVDYSKCYIEVCKNNSNKIEIFLIDKMSKKRLGKINGVKNLVIFLEVLEHFKYYKNSNGSFIYLQCDKIMSLYDDWNQAFTKYRINSANGDDVNRILSKEIKRTIVSVTLLASIIFVGSQVKDTKIYANNHTRNEQNTDNYTSDEIQSSKDGEKSYDSDIVGPSPYVTIGPKLSPYDYGEEIFTRYDLSDSQILQLARLCAQEQGIDSMEAISDEASLMANIFEVTYNGAYKGEKGADGLVSFVRNSGWFANSREIMSNGSSNNPINNEIIDTVKTALVDGIRTLPQGVIEHDGHSEVYIDSYSEIVRQNSQYFDNPISYYFFRYAGKNSSKDPMGYIKADDIDGNKYYDYNGDIYQCSFDDNGILQRVCIWKNKSKSK